MAGVWGLMARGWGLMAGGWGLVTGVWGLVTGVWGLVDGVGGLRANVWGSLWKDSWFLESRGMWSHRVRNSIVLRQAAAFEGKLGTRMSKGLRSGRVVSVSQRRHDCSLAVARRQGSWSLERWLPDAQR